MIAPLPDDETQRLDALLRFDILDTPPEQAFDDLARLASQICGTPIALVTLADESRHWFKAKVGLDLSETPRDAAFCEYAIAGQDICVVGDARADERFATNPSVVSDPYVRFYAGVPLRTAEGFALGTLCVLDTVPRELTPVQADALRMLGRQVMAQLELRRYAALRSRDAERARDALRREGALRDRFMESATDAMVALDLEGRFTLVNRRACEMAGRSEDDLLGTWFTDLVPPDAVAGVAAEFSRVTTEHASIEGYETDVVRPDGSVVTVAFNVAPLLRDGRLIGAAATAEDITERKRAEKALHKSEARYRALAESAPLGIIEVDDHGRIVFVNGEMRRMFGYESDELIGQPVAMLMPERFREAHAGHQQSYARNPAARVMGSNSEIVGRRKDGSEFPADIGLTPLRWGAAFAMATISDITERKQAEKALRKSEARYRALAENAFDPVCELDSEGRFVYVSPNFKSVLGYSPSELIGRVAFELIHLDDQERVAQEYARAIADPTSGTITFRFRRSDTTWAWLDVSASIYRNDAGESHAVIVARDIGERMDLEATLRESEALYRDLIENANDIVYTHDLQGNFTSVNGAGLRTYGLKTEDVATLNIRDIVHPGSLAVAAEKIRSKLSGEVERTEAYELLTQAHDGTPVWVEVSTRILRVDGRPAGVHGIARDITARKRAESLLTTQRHLLEMIAVGTPLEAVLETLARTIEAQADGALCSLLLLSPDGKQLRHAAAPSLPDVYTQAIDGAFIGPVVGSCGTAAYLRKEVVVEDIANDPLWAAYRDLALPHGLRSCWSTPIFSSAGEVLGTFAVYYREPGGVRGRDRELVEMATHIAGIAIERKRAEDAVHSRGAELEAMYQRLSAAHAELEESKARLEEKSVLLAHALELERERSRRDPLTGLLNHAAITDTLRDLTAGGRQQTLALTMVDVDGLKAANDTYGHQIGDAVLMLVADKLSRDGVIVGRYGGDEFVAILPGADRAAAEAYRLAVLESLTEAGLIDPETGANVPVVVSVGIAVYPEEAGAADDLIRLSDSAMYASRRERPDKGSGRTLSRTLGGDRAAKMVGEIVPLLTSPGALDDKLRLVGHRLSVGAGYDGVSFIMDGGGEAEPALSAFARIPEARLQEWNQLRRDAEIGPIDEVMRRTMRPIIIDDLETTELFTDTRRRILVGVGFHSALIAPMIWEDQMIGALSVASKQRDAFTVRDVEFVGAVATQVTAIVQMSRVVEQLRASSAHLLEAHESTVMMLASAAEAHDRATGRHLERVRLISEALAHELGYDDAGANELGMAAILHDIGKIRVPDTVLGSSQSLADAEWVLMKQHTVWGSAFLDGQPGFELASMVARCHHERWDGAGYPDGLAGSDIPEAAQITTVADSFDAMTNDRPYRNGRPIAEAVDEIVACSGTQFSPRVVDALVRLFERGELGFLHADDETQQVAA